MSRGEGTGWGIDHDRSHDLVRNPWPVESAAGRSRSDRRGVDSRGACCSVASLREMEYLDAA